MVYDEIKKSDHYQSGFNPNEKSKKSWWLIGLLISGYLIFAVFVTFFVFHSKEFLKSQAIKNDSFKGYH